MKFLQRITLGIISAVLAAAGLLQTAGATSGDITVSGFNFPDSSIYDIYINQYLVSNTGNAPTGPAVPGFISAVNTSGQVTNLKWIDGANSNSPLNDPLGMAIYGTRLYIADLTTVHVFDAITGHHMTDISIPGTTTLNHLAVFWGGVFVSDTGFDFATGTPTGAAAIYKIDGLTNQVSTLAAGPQLSFPEGMLYDPVKGLLLASLASTTIHSVNINNGALSNFVTLPDVGHDGIAQVGSSYYFSNPPTGHIYKTDLTGNDAALFATYPNFPANIGSDVLRGRLLIPELFGNTLVIKQL